MSIKNYEQAKKYLFEHIPHSNDVQFPGVRGFLRMKHLMKLLGDPQNKYKTLHVAGTSGKGSTSYIASMILKSHGFKTGLHVSPYIIDIRERMQINNAMISKKDFTKYLSEIFSAIEQCKQSNHGQPTYFEIVTALTFYAFWKKKVDYAVIETGLGGTYDATNVITKKDKVVIITKIGKDHTRILGNTLEKIAEQKAGIIQHKNSVVALWDKERVRKVFEKKSRQKKATLNFVEPSVVSHISLSKKSTQFNFSFTHVHFEKLELGMIGEYQAKNASLALVSCAKIFKKEKLVLNEKKIRKAFWQTKIPARFEICKINGREVILDIAHNPQKMRGFVSSLSKIYPNQKFVFLLAFKKEKNSTEMLRVIKPISRWVILSSFFNDKQDFIHISKDLKELKKEAIKVRIQPLYIICDIKNAFEFSLKKDTKHPLVITGSSYFIGDIYRLLQQKYVIL